ncbi:hypothetical protein COCVIDRAFT_109791 [Bipolaris victoriae FI3]|uniref:Uncharacterized protein n=1 Tax=Bipolaris victoriae (strain FI3) TaxID=930091 RepID=W7EAN3_BIPV3|nr:hypothetical protein COCVIDRAFT_109791 [Bipolaris victoriae FI3]
MYCTSDYHGEQRTSVPRYERHGHVQDTVQKRKSYVCMHECVPSPTSQQQKETKLSRARLELAALGFLLLE